MISISGNQSQSIFELEQDGQNMEVELEGVDLRPDLKAIVTFNKKLMIMWKSKNSLSLHARWPHFLI